MSSTGNSTNSVGTNDPSTLRINIPTDECTEKRRVILQKRVPLGWVVGRSTKTGECYYYHEETGASQWNFPGKENLTGGSRRKRNRKQRKSKTIKRK
jgi:hypothetical protein